MKKIGSRPIHLKKIGSRPIHFDFVERSIIFGCVCENLEPDNNLVKKIDAWRNEALAEKLKEEDNEPDI